MAGVRLEVLELRFEGGARRGGQEVRVVVDAARQEGDLERDGRRGQREDEEKSASYQLPDEPPPPNEPPPPEKPPPELPPDDQPPPELPPPDVNRSEPP